MGRYRLLAGLVLIGMAGCGGAPVGGVSPSHLSEQIQAKPLSGAIPPVVQQSLLLPKPDKQLARYSVEVNNVSVQELLAALARDAKLNLDIHPGVSGKVSLHAIQQTVPQILARVAKQVEMRFELVGNLLSVMPDSPFLQHYRIDYVNLSRTVSGAVAASTQIASTSGASPAGGTSVLPLAGSNVSSTRIENVVRNEFWANLEKSVKDLLRETDKILPEGSSETTVEHTDRVSSEQATSRDGPAPAPTRGNARGRGAADNVTANVASTEREGGTVVRRLTYREAASVIVHPESGVVSVRATAKQHEKVAEFIERVMNAARRQVMIEATIVEVELADAYQQGIEWSRLRADDAGFSVRPAAIDAGSGASVQPFILSFLDRSNPLSLSGVLNLLQSFGNTRVLSSPRLSVMNNQTAILKVVENFVYFNVKADTTATSNVGTTTAVTTTPQSVSVGLVMTVTPQVSESEMVILNVRPSISSISALKEDPNPSIPAGVKNYVPQIRIREIESVMRVGSGDVAVLGGLMEEGINYRTGRVPLIGEVPLLGELFTSRSNSGRKSELVILLRPVVIKEASLAGDFAGLGPQLLREGR